MTAIPSSLARHAATMREPDPDRGWAASRAALESGMVLISLETVETKAGWLYRERLQRFVEGFIAEVDEHCSRRPGPPG